MADTNQQRYVRSEGGRGPEDMAAMQAARESGTCPFCQIIAGERADQPVEHQTAHWAVFFNIRPEDGTELHLTIAAKIPPEHGPEFTFDKLDYNALLEVGPLIRDLTERFGIRKGRSVFMRIDPTGDDTASTVFHPCWHIIVSNGLPIREEDINPTIHKLLKKRRNDIVMAFREAEPELAQKFADKGGDHLWVEALKYLMSNAGLLRSLLTGKSVEVRPKFSNLANSGVVSD